MKRPSAYARRLAALQGIPRALACLADLEAKAIEQGNGDRAAYLGKARQTLEKDRRKQARLIRRFERSQAARKRPAAQRQAGQESRSAPAPSFGAGKSRSR